MCFLFSKSTKSDALGIISIYTISMLGDNQHRCTKSVSKLGSLDLQARYILRQFDTSNKNKEDFIYIGGETITVGSPPM